MRSWRTKNALSGHPEWRVPVLGYHSVDRRPASGFDPLPPDVFEQHLAYISQHHNVVSAGEVARCRLRGETLPRGTVALSFDDGYRDHYEVVFPLLKKYSVPATFFVPTGFISGEVTLPEDPAWPPMTWDQAREMAECPLVDFGAHAHTHLRLSGLSDDAVVEEVESSKAILEDRLQRPAELFAYPYGLGPDVPRVAVETVARLGFQAAFSTFSRSTHGAGNRFFMNRVPVYGRNSVADLKDRLAGGYDFVFYQQKLKAIYSSKVRRRGIWRSPGL